MLVYLSRDSKASPLSLAGLVDAESLVALKDLINKLGGEATCTEEVCVTVIWDKMICFPLMLFLAWKCRTNSLSHPVETLPNNYTLLPCRSSLKVAVEQTCAPPTSSTPPLQAWRRQTWCSWWAQIPALRHRSSTLVCARLGSTTIWMWLWSGPKWT